MRIVPLFGSSLAALSQVASAQMRTNLFYDIHQDADKSMFILRGTPAITLWTTLPFSPIRGMVAIGNHMYVVADNNLFQLGASGNYTYLGSFGNSGQSSPVEMANNPEQLMIVDGSNGAYIYQFSALETAINAEVSTIQAGLVDVTSMANQYTGQSTAAAGGGGQSSPTNPGVLPRVITPRLGGYR